MNKRLIIFLSLLFIFDNSTQFSENFEFLIVGEDPICWKHGDTNKTYSKSVFEDFMAITPNVISIADGDSLAPFSSYYLARKLAIETSQFLDNPELDENNTRKEYLKTLININDSYNKEIDSLKNDQINIERDHLLKGKSYAAYQQDKFNGNKKENPFAKEIKKEIENLSKKIDENLISASTITNAFLTEDKDNNLKLNVLQIVDSSIVHFKLVNVDGSKIYVPNVFTGDDKMYPGGAKTIRSNAEKLFAKETKNICNKRI